MKARLLNSTDIDKKAWDAVINTSPQRSIFLESWLLDAQLGKWQGIIVESNEGIEAVMPLNLKSKYGLHYSLQPLLARYWGLCYKANTFNNREAHSWNKEVCQALISAIPNNLVAFRHYFNPDFDYGLPFYWHGYKLNVQYTNILDLTLGYETLLKGFSSNTRNEINRAERAGLEVKDDTGFENLKNILLANEANNKLLLAQKHFSMLERMIEACTTRGRCINKTVWYEEKPILSAICFYDEKSTYFITNNADPAYRHIRASAILMSELLKEATLHSRQFDFLGSMIENIEGSFKKFGTKSVPYLDISKIKKPFHLIL